MTRKILVRLLPRVKSKVKFKLLFLCIRVRLAGAGDNLQLVISVEIMHPIIPLCSVTEQLKGVKMLVSCLMVVYNCEELDCRSE